MNLLATTPWWRRRFHLTRRQVLAHNFRITPPPVPPAVREQMETESALEPEAHWDIAPMALAVRHTMAFELPDDVREKIVQHLER